MSTAALEPLVPVLVCATPSTDTGPVVVLANGSYATEHDRVFWGDDPRDEVLRLPLSAPVTIRPVRRTHPAAARPEGLRALADAVRQARTTSEQLMATATPTATPTSTPPATPTAQGDDLASSLGAALRTGDAPAAHAFATLLSERGGPAAVYAALSECLASLGDDWATRRGPVLAERTASHAAAAVAARLLAEAPAPTLCGTVVLATPPGDRHTLALTALAHLLQAAGRPVLVVDDLPLDELAQLAAAPGTAAVVLSAHVALPVVAARQLLSTLRRAAPEVFLAIGGPGFPRATSAAADLVTDDVALLLKELDAQSSVLTSREREVLLGVADGLTNAEIALQLGLSPSTVKTHLDHVFAKTRTEHRAAAVARALRQGWIR